MARRSPSLAEIFAPRGVAIVGVSGADQRGFASGVVRSLIDAGFPAIYPVNPKYDEAMGLKCYPNLQAIPGMVDHVIVSIPAEAALPLLDDCTAKGVKSVHFFTAGFSESGYQERAELEKAMLAKARSGGFRIIGPNCVGMSLPKVRLVTLSGMPLESGPIAFISQSGGHAHDLPYSSGPRGLRFGKVVSYGNALDVDESELLEYLAQDPETEIIAAYIEGVKDGRRFINALREAATRKPVVIYKGGTTEAGKRAAHGHTASLTSSVAVFEALCRQLGAIRVDDIEELVDVLVALRFTHPLPKGPGVAVVGMGGGPSVMASDEVEKAGLYMPTLSPEAQTKLRRFLPLAGTIVCNPIDAAALLSPEGIAATMGVLGEVGDVDMVIYHLGFHPGSRWGGGRFSSSRFLGPFVHALTQAGQTTGKPILLALRPAPDLDGMRDFLAAQEAFVAAGFPVFHSLRQAAKAVARVVSWNNRGT